MLSYQQLDKLDEEHGEVEKDDKEEEEKKKLPRKTKSLTDIVKEFSMNTTMHGPPLVVSCQHWWAKLFWFAAFLGFTVIFFYQGYYLMFEFFHFPYTTKVDLITEKLLDFPAVTVCNLNRMRRSELRGTRFEGFVEVDGGFVDDWYEPFPWGSSSDPEANEYQFDTFWEFLSGDDGSVPKDYTSLDYKPTFDLRSTNNRDRRATKSRRKGDSKMKSVELSEHHDHPADVDLPVNNRPNNDDGVTSVDFESPPDWTSDFQGHSKGVSDKASTFDFQKSNSDFPKRDPKKTSSFDSPDSSSDSVSILNLSWINSEISSNFDFQSYYDSASSVDSQSASSFESQSHSESVSISDSQSRSESASSSGSPIQSESASSSDSQTQSESASSSDIQSHSESASTSDFQSHSKRASTSDFQNSETSNFQSHSADVSSSNPQYSGPSIDYDDYESNPFTAYSFNLFHHYFYNNPFDYYDTADISYDFYMNDWDVEGGSDWEGFYTSSTSQDFSDIIDVANPTVEELRKYGHQAEDFILQCTFDKRNCDHL